MHENNIKKPNTFLKERVCRTKIFIFVKKNLIAFCLFAIVVGSFLFNVWDIKKYEIYDLEGKEVNESVKTEISAYISDNVVGKNYFQISPIKIGEQIYREVPQVIDTHIEKSMPNKLIIFVNLCEQKYVGNLKKNSCVLLSESGIVLKDLCEEGEESCCENYSTENNLVYFSSNDVDVSFFDNDKDKVLVIQDIKDIVTLLEVFKYEIRNVHLEKEIVEVQDIDGKTFRFSLATNLEEQLQRLVVVLGQVNSNEMSFSSLDFRFERPVMKP
jgi:hypothetical protein